MIAFDFYLLFRAYAMWIHGLFYTKYDKTAAFTHTIIVETCVHNVQRPQIKIKQGSCNQDKGRILGHDVSG